EGHAEGAEDLAGSLADGGTALRSLTRYDEALRDLDRAVSIRRRLVEKEGRWDLANWLAGTLSNRGDVLSAMARYADALADYDRGAEERRVGGEGGCHGGGGEERGGGL